MLRRRVHRGLCHPAASIRCLHTPPKPTTPPLAVARLREAAQAEGLRQVQPAETFPDSTELLERHFVFGTLAVRASSTRALPPLRAPVHPGLGLRHYWPEAEGTAGLMRVGGAGCAQGAGVLRCEYWLDAANERAWLIADASTVSHGPHSTTHS